MKEPASQRTAAAMEAGFAKGGLESTVEGTNAAGKVPTGANIVPSVPSPAAAGQCGGTTQQFPQSTPQQQVKMHHLQTHTALVELMLTYRHRMLCICTKVANPQTSMYFSCLQGGVWGGGGFKSMHTQQFKSSFVTSGITGGDIGQKPTIVAARVASTQPVVLPPPPPVVPAVPAHSAASNASVQAVGSAMPPLSFFNWSAYATLSRVELRY